MSITNIQIPTTWVDINTLSGVAVGTAMTLQNQSTHRIRLTESTSTPTDSDLGKVILPLNIENNGSDATITAGSLKIWARLDYPSSVPKYGRLAVQEI